MNLLESRAGEPFGSSCAPPPTTLLLPEDRARVFESVKPPRGRTNQRPNK